MQKHEAETQPKSLVTARELEHHMQKAMNVFREDLAMAGGDDEYFDNFFRLLSRTFLAAKQLRNAIYRAEEVLG